jgi:pyruvate ferredoxin oxidoreductase alpha subunit
MRVLEGSDAIAAAVRVARPKVISAYPITPQTHIVEALAAQVAEGSLDAEFMTVESEHSAASAVLGASATGVRVYTATSSQGLLYMAEVVFNIAGMRLPVVMTVANRALSGPLSIWNDHQDSMTMRDAGWVQLFAQTPQEAHDLHLAAYRVAEDRRVLLPVMVCVDGFVLTHSYEPVDVASQETADRFLPPFDPPFVLDPDRPLTLGAYADPRFYTEARYEIEAALAEAPGALSEALEDLGDLTGRRYAPSLDRYRLDDAEIVLVAMGTAAQTARIAVDAARDRGIGAGLVALRMFRPFPAEAVREAVAGARRVVVLDRAVSLGAGGPVVTEVRAALYSADPRPDVVGVVAGLGGRDVSVDTLERALDSQGDGWIDLRPDLVGTS